MSKPKVYFTKTLTSERIIDIFKCLNKELPGKIAVKIHSGEEGNQNYLKPSFLKPMVDYVKGTVVECNTAYGGARNSTVAHRKLLNDHGWNKIFPNFDLLDATYPDLKLEIPNGKVIKETYVGKHIENYDSMLIISHFKGHPMGGYGGALKQLSIGCGSIDGKSIIHSAGKYISQYKIWNDLPAQDLFLESMADAASALVKYFKGNMAFINLMCNMSVDCDCCAVAEDPCIKDIGILGSLDPIAIDRACIDKVLASDDPGKEHFLERVNSRNGTHTIDAAFELGFGNKEYELVDIDS